MRFKYDSAAYLQDENKHINVEQLVNPFNMKNINNFEDAEKWMRQFLSFELNAQPLFFSLAIKNIENDMQAYELVKNKVYSFTITESSGRLSGEYQTTISCLDNNEKIEVTLMFADGEATIEHSFDSKGNYRFDLDNDFYIGQDKFIAIINESDKSLLKDNTETLTFTINEK